MIEKLPPVGIPGHEPSGRGFPSHPMRVMTRQIAGLEPGGWDRQSETSVSAIFDALAPEWHTRISPKVTDVVRDALGRGLSAVPAPTGLCIEVGAGIGTYTPLLAKVFAEVIAIDLSWEMLARAPRETLRVQGDGGRLPVRDAAADAVVLINAFLFPGEVARVLGPGGVLMWVNSSGEQTPIHLTTDEVAGALGFPVSGVESRAGAGTWCVLRRA